MQENIEKNKYNLPRGYLSYSAFDLWLRNKEAYRRKYYLNEPDFKTRETEFGKDTDSFLDNGGHIEGVIRYSHSQYRIEVELDGLKLLGYLDGFDEPTLSILERKTGHKNLKGKMPWDLVKVHKHKQLVYYSVLVQLKHGKVNPTTILQWLETDFMDETMEFDGNVLTAQKKNLALTGKVMTFKRKIAQWERDKLLKEIFIVAEEISNDYTQWQKNQNQEE